MSNSLQVPNAAAQQLAEWVQGTALDAGLMGRFARGCTRPGWRPAQRWPMRVLTLDRIGPGPSLVHRRLSSGGMLAARSYLEQLTAGRADRDCA